MAISFRSSGEVVFRGKSITLRFNGLSRMFRDLERFRSKAIPFAMRATLNETAFAARKLWVDEIQRTLVTRNTFTTRSLHVEKATGRTVLGMKAVLGSRAPYMGDREGASRSDRGPVPTTVASGEGRSGKPRRRLVRRPNRIGSITLPDKVRQGSRKQRTAVTIAMAARKGHRTVFLELERRKGFFRLTGGKRRPKVDMLWDTSKKSHAVKAHPTLGPALKRVGRLIPGIQRKALLAELRRNRIAGY
jgi:hypothetical protein